VDDDPLIGECIHEWLKPLNYEVVCAKSGAVAMQILEHEAVSLVLLDNSLPDTSGVELFGRIREMRMDLPTLFITGYPNWEQGVELMRQGACDYLAKPFSPAALQTRVQQILTLNRLQNQVDYLRRGNAASTPDVLVGESAAIRSLSDKVGKLAEHRQATVLITGETGTGKGVFARLIHQRTCGDTAPLVDIDCSTLPRELCESELFGHEKGAFTGAHRVKPGLFEVAEGGTVFLDEIGELDINLQAKLLRVLESRIFKRVGGHALMQMGARVIAATNRPLPEMVREHRFREDLFFRLNVFELHIPPLRERPEDVMPLAEHFLKMMNQVHGRNISGFEPAASQFLRGYHFPGNIRELRNLIERAVINTQGTLISLAVALPVNVEVTTECSASEPCGSPQGPDTRSLQSIGGGAGRITLADSERVSIVTALHQTDGNKSRAASLLGISRNALLRRMKKYGLALEDEAVPQNISGPK